MTTRDDINVTLISLPTTIRGLTVPSQDGMSYNIFLNANLTYEMQCQTYEHELAHINGDDFGADEPVAELEARL